MNAIVEAIAKIFGKIADNTQGRIERLKNEKNALKKELDELTSQEWTFNRASRARCILARMRDIDDIMQNNAHD